MDIYQKLTNKKSFSEYLTLCALGNIEAVHIHHPKASAIVSLFGGHVLSYRPAREKDLIWMSSRADFSGKKALRGGIPVCWPWFGKFRAPGHGFARTSHWSIAEFTESPQYVSLSLSLKSSEETLKIWPFEFQTTLKIEISDAMKVSLEGTNTDSKAWDMGGALHTYLSVSDISSTSVSGVGNEFIDGTNGNEVKPSSGTLSFDEETDQVFLRPENRVIINDASASRRITVDNTGNNCVVVWNPWKTLSSSMADMSDDGFRTMVCVESADYNSSLTLQPDQSHAITTEISLR
ncbi:D-hexose-6-phosphate mutarotase [Veronia nyctiphanis]|uniref:Putative glucose-6-phosphate 1-epimerase n=2 Tax=Veronia nyctiphanis TaxID=1278244 RepID=A0A4Q0YR35_9GAMM|nr:D-hexose-6-phosphate mutarotase [Veronia nyctiphanis]